MRTRRIAHPRTAGFDRIISYEEISTILRKHDVTPRGQYRANFIATAAMHHANTWTRVSDETTNTFWATAYRMATAEFPILEHKPLNLTKDSSWISIRPRDLPARPVRTYVSLKGDRGFIDLTLTGASFGSFYKGATPLLRADMSAHATGKSSAIRIEVEGFRPSEDLSSALPRVRRAFAACADLIAFIVSTGNDLTEWHLKRCHSRIRPEN